MGGESAGKKGGGDTAGGNGKGDSPPGANSGKDGAVKEGLASTPWSVDEEETPPRLIRRQYAAASAILVEEGSVGSHDAVEGRALLSDELANTLVQQSPKLVVVVPGQLIDGLVGQGRQATEGDYPQRRPYGTKTAIDVKKGEVVELVVHLARGVCSVAFVEEALGEAVTVTQPQRKRVTNVEIPKDGDE